jgi:hypothetical protein
MERSEAYRAIGPIETAHLARLIFEASISGLCEIRRLLLRYITCTCRDRVKHRLPDMGGITIDQYDSRHTLIVLRPASERGGNFDPCYSTTHHNDPSAPPVDIHKRSPD